MSTDRAVGALPWRIAADNDIAAAYAYGVDTDVPNPGRDEAVVTDAAILAAVDAIVNPPAPVEPVEDLIEG